MKCIVVDDDKMSVNLLTHLIKQAEFLEIVKICPNAGEAKEILENEKIDLVFLDIEMPGMSGMELLKNLNTRAIIILTTSHKEYALEAFEYNIADYLVKPFAFPRFLKAVTRAKELFDSQKVIFDSSDKEYVFIKINSVLTKVQIKSILWIEATGNYLKISTENNKKIILHMTLKALEDKIPPEKFLRVHRSFIVAIDHITTVEDNSIYIGENLIPLGAVYKEEFFKRLNLL